MATVDRLSHLNTSGQAQMVDVGKKSVTHRRAVATGFISLSEQVLALLRENKLKKGDAIQVARLAGIMAAKRTHDLIPLCHPLPLSHIDVQIKLEAGGARITATVACEGKTGVEMEALTACSIAALTVYDMCKAVDKMMVIGEICLLEKEGGRSGTFKRGSEG